MKIKDKKKNLTKDLGSNKPFNGPNGPVEYHSPYIIPAGYKAVCHLHHNPRLFKTMDELQKHVRKDHRVWKG